MQNKVYIISGSQGEGKTSFLIGVVRQLKIKGYKVGGIIAHGFWKNNQRDSFELENIRTEERLLFCSRKAHADWQKIRHFYINPAGEEFGNEALVSNLRQKPDLIVIDEVGPFEIEDKGWSDSIHALLRNTNLPMVWVVREQLIKEVIAHFKISRYEEIKISEQSPGTMIIKILKDIN